MLVRFQNLLLLFLVLLVFDVPQLRLGGVLACRRGDLWQV